MTFIELNEKQASNLDFDIKNASELLFQDIAILLEWAEGQEPNFFEGLTLQEILNVYRVTADYEDFEDYLDVNPSKAVEDYNRAVGVGNQITAE